MGPGLRIVGRRAAKKTRTQQGNNFYMSIDHSMTLMTCSIEWPALSTGVDGLIFQVAYGAGDLLVQLEHGVDDPISQGDLLFQLEQGVDDLISQGLCTLLSILRICITRFGLTLSADAL